ncbi:MAG: histone deacetylase [Thermoplasmata archaeon]|nr:histone deacetylase [Thermoplasmata archaeon]
MKIVYHERYLEHVQHFGHPECPERLKAITGALASHGLFTDVVKPEKAVEKDILAVHTPEYISYLSEIGEGIIDMDTSSHSETYEIALLSAGGALTAGKIALEEGASIALVRPPGHHAGKDFGGGFCYINNAAVCARAMLENCKRVAIVDIDGHHGNGTQDIFYSSPEVLYISTHQLEIYPGTGHLSLIGEKEGAGYNLNIPFFSGCGDASYLAAFEEIILPVLDSFKPGLVIVSLGVDSHTLDPLTGLEVSTKGYLEMLKSLFKYKTMFLLEGGYDLDALADVFCALVSAREGRDYTIRYPDSVDSEGRGRERIDAAKKLFSNYWKL